MDWRASHHVKQARHRRTNTAPSHLSVGSKNAELRVTNNKMAVARGRRRRACGRGGWREAGEGAHTSRYEEDEFWGPTSSLATTVNGRVTRPKVANGPDLKPPAQRGRRCEGRDVLIDLIVAIISQWVYVYIYISKHRAVQPKYIQLLPITPQ